MMMRDAIDRGSNSAKLSKSVSEWRNRHPITADGRLFYTTASISNRFIDRLVILYTALRASLAKSIEFRAYNITIIYQISSGSLIVGSDKSNDSSRLETKTEPAEGKINTGSRGIQRHEISSLTISEICSKTPEPQPLILKYSSEPVRLGKLLTRHWIWFF